jgi:U3 small nucleolar RNA-associated protein 10
MFLLLPGLSAGVSGLEELIKLNPRFEEFHRSLFDLTSRSLERSVEDKKTNKTLNKHIRRFLLLLSPYFLIKASHKALEWLVNR